MKSKKALVLAAGGCVLLGLLVVGTVVWRPLVWIVLGLLQVLVLLVLLDSRRVLSARIFATTSKLERQLRTSGSAASRNGSKGSSSSHTSTGAQTPDEADVRTILASRIFDTEWYEVQADAEFPTAAEAVGDYLSRGRRAGLTPHPLFDPTFVFPKDWRTSKTDPLLKYIRNVDDAWTKPTSAVFDPALLDERLPESDFGPLASFVLNRGAEYPLPHERVDGNPAPTLTRVRADLVRASRDWHAREQALVPSRGSAEAPREEESLAELRAAFDAGDDRPLVSIVLPTWNRAASIRASIESVKNQSYDRWELIVADDGSVDDTELIVASESSRDARVHYLKLDHRGVSAARNSALAAATGDYVAFLDSDKAWDPEFLHTLIAHLVGTGTDAAYSVTAVSFGPRTVHHTVPATRESLLASNSVDQTALVVSRSVLDRTGGFDESLRRAVDYDLILSLTEITDLHLVPFVGVRYTEDDQDPNRISESQSVAWNFHVRDKHKWRRFEEPELTPGRVTVVVDGIASGRELRNVLAGLTAWVDGADHEIIVIAESHDWALVRSLEAVTSASGTAAVRFVYSLAGGSLPLSVNEAMRRATGEFLFLMSGGHRPLDGSLTDLLDELRTSEAEALHPVVLDGTRLIHDAGVVFPDGSTDPVPFLRGLPRDWPEWKERFVETPAAPWPLLMRTASALSVRGMNTKLRKLWADLDFSRRLSAERPILLDTHTAFQLLRANTYAKTADAAADVRMFHEEWSGRSEDSRALLDAAGVDVEFAGFDSVSAEKNPALWPVAHVRPRPLTSVKEGVPRLRWAIKTAAPAHEGAASWGDYHFGQSLASALRELGQSAVVDYGPNAARESAHLDDVVLNLRGLESFALPTESTKLLWVISHPDDVAAREIVGYDKAYAASTTWPGLMKSQWGVDVTPLLQCTDPSRFFIDDPADEVADKLVMVGNSRHQYRPAAWHTAHAGLPVAVYGNDWEGRVPEENIAGSYIPNDELRRYYRGARWALNDHWSDMRDHGFVSNRIFDVLASGGRLLTDEVDGLDDLVPRDILPQGVATFRSPAELLSVAEAGPGAVYTDENLRAASEYVRTHHSFAARAQVMLDDVLRLRSRKD